MLVLSLAIVGVFTNNKKGEAGNTNNGINNFVMHSGANRDFFFVAEAKLLCIVPLAKAYGNR